MRALNPSPIQSDRLKINEPSGDDDSNATTDPETDAYTQTHTRTHIYTQMREHMAKPASVDESLRELRLHPRKVGEQQPAPLARGNRPPRTAICLSRDAAGVRTWRGMNTAAVNPERGRPVTSSGGARRLCTYLLAAQGTIGNSRRQRM